MFLTTFLSGCKAIYKPKGRKKSTPFPNHSHPGLHSLELKHSFKFFLEEGINFRSQLPATYPTKQVEFLEKSRELKLAAYRRHANHKYTLQSTHIVNMPLNLSN